MYILLFYIILYVYIKLKFLDIIILNCNLLSTSNLLSEDAFTRFEV